MYQMEIEDGWAFCKDEAELAEFAADGMWDSIEDLEEETGVQRSELIGKWFLIIHGRVFFK